MLPPENLTKNFLQTEFLCPCGACNGGSMNSGFMDSLQHYRDLCKIPFIILSGFRCEKENIRVGGESDSRHLVGCAADIRFHDGEEFYKLIKFVPLFFNGFGINNGSIHVDTRPSPPMAWTYYKNYEKKTTHY